MRPKLRERAEARTLREAGLSYKRIAARVGVSPGTVYRWTCDIELTAEQKSLNLSGPTGPQSSAHVARRAAAWSARCRAKRAAYQEEGRADARAGDALHLQGCILYWTEGAKARNSLRFANSDLAMVALFRRFLTDAMSVRRDAILMCLNVYTNNGLTINEIEDHWLDVLDLPRGCLRKHALDHAPTSSSGQAKGRLPYGVCTLIVHDTRVTQRIFGAIQEYGQFERPEWLD